MAALNKLSDTVYQLIAKVSKNLTAIAGVVTKPVKRSDHGYKNRDGSKEQVHVTDIENALLKKMAFKLFPLSNIKPDVSTGKLPVPPGMIKFLDIYSKTINRK